MSNVHQTKRMDMNNMMVLLTQHSKAWKTGLKQRNKVTSPCGSVLGSLETLIPEPVRFSAVPRKLLLNVSMHFWCAASPSVNLTEMKALLLLLFATSAVQSSCPGCPLEVENGSFDLSFVHQHFSSGGKAWLRTGGSGGLGGAPTSRVWRKMSENPARSQGLFHSGENYSSW